MNTDRRFRVILLNPSIFDSCLTQPPFASTLPLTDNDDYLKIVLALSGDVRPAGDPLPIGVPHHWCCRCTILMDFDHQAFTIFKYLRYTRSDTWLLDNVVYHNTLTCRVLCGPSWPACLCFKHLTTGKWKKWG